MRGAIKLSRAKETYDAAAVMTYLKYHAMKVVTIQTMVPQVVFLVLVLLALTLFLPGGTAANNGIAQSTAQTESSIDFAANVGSFPAWYRWASDLIATLQAEYIAVEKAETMGQGTNLQRYPIGGLLVRHFAHHMRPCPRSALSNRIAVFDPSLSVGECRGTKLDEPNEEPLHPHIEHDHETSSATAATANGTIGPNGVEIPFFSGSAWKGKYTALSDHLHPLFQRNAITTLDQSARLSKWNSVVFIPFNQTWMENTLTVFSNGSATTESLEWYFNATGGWEELARGAWLDEPSIAVAVDYVIYHVPQQLFVSYQTVLELKSAGEMKTHHSVRPFRLHTLSDSWDRGFLAVLVMLALLVVFQLLEFLYRCTLKREFSGRWIVSMEASDWFHLASIFLSGTTVSLHFYMFSLAAANQEAMTANSAQTGSSEALYATTYLLAVSEWTDTLSVLFAWVTFCAFVRMFIFLRYCGRLSLVNETLISGIHDFIGIGLVAVLILCTYAFTGYLLWFHTQTAFSSFGGALLALFNLMISLEVQDFHLLYHHHPNSTLVFFVSFFIVAWCVILNVTVGILATSFASALETQTFVRRPNWSLYSLLHDGKSLLRRIFFVGVEGRDDSVPLTPGPSIGTIAPEERNKRLLELALAEAVLRKHYYRNHDGTRQDDATCAKLPTASTVAGVRDTEPLMAPPQCSSTSSAMDLQELEKKVSTALDAVPYFSESLLYKCFKLVTPKSVQESVSAVKRLKTYLLFQLERKQFRTAHTVSSSDTLAAGAREAAETLVQCDLASFVERKLSSPQTFENAARPLGFSQSASMPSPEPFTSESQPKDPTGKATKRRDTAPFTGIAYSPRETSIEEEEEKEEEKEKGHQDPFSPTAIPAVSGEAVVEELQREEEQHLLQREIGAGEEEESEPSLVFSQPSSDDGEVSSVASTASPPKRAALLMELYLQQRKTAESTNPGYVTLATLTEWASIHTETGRRIGHKSTLHVGLHDAKLREWKMLQAVVEGGHDVTTQLAIHYRQLQQLHELLCLGVGGMRRTGADETMDEEEQSSAVQEEGALEALRVAMLELLAHTEATLERSSATVQSQEMERLRERLDVVLQGLNVSDH